MRKLFYLLIMASVFLTPYAGRAEQDLFKDCGGKIVIKSAHEKSPNYAKIRYRSAECEKEEARLRDSVRHIENKNPYGLQSIFLHTVQPIYSDGYYEMIALKNNEVVGRASSSHGTPKMADDHNWYTSINLRLRKPVSLPIDVIVVRGKDEYYRYVIEPSEE